MELTYNQRYWLLNKEELVKKHRIYYERNKNKVKKVVLSWRERNSIKYNAYDKKYQKYYRGLHREERTKWLEEHPWYKTYISISSRINGSYSNKGIKNFLSVDNLKNIWFRDKAHKMRKPNIHRIDNNGDYSIENCKYVEEKWHRAYHKKHINKQAVQK